MRGGLTRGKKEDSHIVAVLERPRARISISLGRGDTVGSLSTSRKGEEAMMWFFDCSVSCLGLVDEKVDEKTDE